MFCSSLPESYEPTAQQYLNNISVIANYQLMDIIAQVLQEESRRKAQSLGQGLSLNKFSPVKNLGQKSVWSVVKLTTQLKITGLEENVHNRARDNHPKKCWVSGNKKKEDKKGKGKAK